MRSEPTWTDVVAVTVWFVGMALAGTRRRRLLVSETTLLGILLLPGLILTAETDGPLALTGNALLIACGLYGAVIFVRAGRRSPNLSGADPERHSRS